MGFNSAFKGLIYVRLGKNLGSVSGVKFLASAAFTKWHRRFQRATKFTRNLIG